MLQNLMRRLRREVPEDVEVQDFDFTPDYWKLEQFKRQLLFVYGDHMTGERNNAMVKEGSFGPEAIHPTCYTGNKFTFWKKDLGVYSFPVMLPEDYSPSAFVRWPVEALPVRGELWSISPRQFKICLDEHMGNGVRFRRERIRIMMPYREVGWHGKNAPPVISEHCTKSVTAWAYVGVTRYWDPQIGGIFASAQVEPQTHDFKKPYVDYFYRFQNTPF